MMEWNRSWGWPFLEQPSHGSASVPNTGAPSGQCQGLPEPWRVAGVSVQQESHLLQLPEHAGFTHQVAAPRTRWQHHPPSSGDVAQAISSWPWDAVAVRVLLTVDNIVFLNSVFCISSATYRKYLILSSYLYGGGRLCTYCSATLALYFSSNCQKLEQIHWQYSCFCSELQSWLFMLLNHMVFLVRNHSCKIDFSSSHFFMMLPLNFAHYILVYYFK